VRLLREAARLVLLLVVACGVVVVLLWLGLG
jgi:hypothetical protein